MGKITVGKNLLLVDVYLCFLILQLYISVYQSMYIITKILETIFPKLIYYDSWIGQLLDYGYRKISFFIILFLKSNFDNSLFIAHQIFDHNWGVLFLVTERFCSFSYLIKIRNKDGAKMFIFRTIENKLTTVYHLVFRLFCIYRLDDR